MALYHSWRLRTRIGRRGAALFVLGFVFIMRGFGYIADPPLPRDTEIGSHVVLAQIMPISAWGVVWMFVGLLAVVQAFAVRKDWHAFAAVHGISLAWAVGMGLAYLELGGNRWVSPATWFLIVAWVQIIAGWPEYEGMTRSFRR
jgi:hypothetical protein